MLMMGHYDMIDCRRESGIEMETRESCCGARLGLFPFFFFFSLLSFLCSSAVRLGRHGEKEGVVVEGGRGGAAREWTHKHKAGGDNQRLFSFHASERGMVDD